MNEVVIAGYLRTAQSRSRPKDPARDWFSKLRADELLSQIMPAVADQVGIDPREINDFLVGTALGIGEQHTFGGREAHLTVQTCWDADRLDLGRVGNRPDPKRLCTDAARDPALLREAYARSLQGRPW